MSFSSYQQFPIYHTQEYPDLTVHSSPSHDGLMMSRGSSESSFGAPSPVSSQGYYAQTPSPPYDIAPPVYPAVGSTTVMSSSSAPKRGKPVKSSPSKEAPSPMYHCLERGCEYMTNRHHDLKRHMVDKHTSANQAVEKGQMLDCPYGGCGHTGVHGFKRLDHARDHSRRYHLRELPKSLGGTGKKVEK